MEAPNSYKINIGRRDSLFPLNILKKRVNKGCGIDISKLRPKNAIVHNAAKSTSGAVSFMDFYSYVTGLIGQSGRRKEFQS